MSYNPIMVWLLYSPLHRILSGVTMVINYRGRKSGKAYRLPIGYSITGKTLLTTSLKNRTWWRNLRGGGDVTLRLQGKDVSAHAEVIEDEQGVVDGIKAFIGNDARIARVFRVKLKADQLPEPESLRQAAQDRVIVRTSLR